MQKILRLHKSFTARLLENILMFSPSREQHAKQVREVLHTLQRFGFTLQLRICEWFRDEVRFLGFVINRHGIKPDPRKIDAIVGRDEPRTIMKVRGFLNAVGYVRHFIKDFATIATPLYQLTRGRHKFKFKVSRVR